MNLLLLGRGDQAEEVLREIGGEAQKGAHQWSTLRAANLIWMLGRCNDASVVLEELARGPESPVRASSASWRWRHASTRYPRAVTLPRKRPGRH